MIVVQTGASRGEQAKLPEQWFTFFPNPEGKERLEKSGVFESLGEGRVPPNSGPQRVRRSGEVVTYVREGSLIYQDTSEAHEVLCAGDFHRTTLGSDFYYQERNASSTHWVHVFQIWFSSNETCSPGHESKRFSSAERRRGLCLVASHDGRNGSLTVHHDASLYSAIIPKGRHLVHALSPRRTACLHVIEGVVKVTGDVVLRSGDTATFTGERAVSFSGRENSEVLLLDLVNGVAPPVKLNS